MHGLCLAQNMGDYYLTDILPLQPEATVQPTPTQAMPTSTAASSVIMPTPVGRRRRNLMTYEEKYSTKQLTRRKVWLEHVREKCVRSWQAREQVK